MAKKAKKRQFSPQVQFRPGPGTEDRLTAFAEENACSPNEAARRLMVLALNGLTADFSMSVQGLMHVMPGNQTFTQACDYLAFSLRQAESTHKESGLTDPQKLQLARDIIAQFGGEEELLDGTREKQKVRVHRQRE